MKNTKTKATPKSAPKHLDLYKAVLADPYRREMKETNDCVVVAITLLTRYSYKTVHTALKEAGRPDRKGTLRSVRDKALEALKLEKVPFDLNAHIGKYAGVHKKMYNMTSYQPTRFPDIEFPDLYCSARQHAFAIKNGATEDWCHKNYLRVQEAFSLVKIK